VVIVPCGIGVSTSEKTKQNVIQTCLEVCNRLNGNINEEDENEIIQKYNSKTIRAHADLRENYTPGWKFNHWELKVNIYYEMFYILCSKIAVIMDF